MALAGVIAVVLAVPGTLVHPGVASASGFFGITSQASTDFLPGVANSFIVRTVGGPTAVITMTGVSSAPGVIYGDNGDGTALITGTPPAGTAGTYPIAISAQVPGGGTATQSFTLTIADECAPGFALVEVSGPSTGPVCSKSFSNVNALQTLVLPAAVDHVTLSASGGVGQGYVDSFRGWYAPGGRGGQETASFPVTPGGTLSIVVGAPGGHGTAPTYGRGGGGGGDPTYANQGGGGSFVFGPDGSLLIAGGGGGGAGSYIGAGGAGGDGGGADGSRGASSNSVPATGGGGGGSQTAGGFNIQGFYGPSGSGSGPATSPTALPDGGAGAGLGGGNGGGGGGGGGYYSGGGGALSGGLSGSGGGGGSGYVAPSGTFASAITGANGGAGAIVVSYSVLAITSAPSATFIAGAASSFVVTTTGTPTPSITESGALPAGITFADKGDGTATLTGTPEGPGAYPISLVASNAKVSDVTQTFILSVAGCNAGFTVTQLSATGSSETVCSVSFSNVNALQTLTVPTAVHQLTINAAGAAGQGNCNVFYCVFGGTGGQETATFGVTPGDTLSIVVGAAGGYGSGTTYGGGGGGGDYANGHQGGGGSFVFGAGGSLLIAAGGGGGGGSPYPGGLGGGGDGGGAAGNGGTRSANYGNPGGGGGSQTSGGGGGGGGGSGSGPATSPTALPSGGQGQAYPQPGSGPGGGGGGGGYYSGGGGGVDRGTLSSGAGGGSGYVAPSGTAATAHTGGHTGDGAVVVYYEALAFSSAPATTFDTDVAGSFTVTTVATAPPSITISGALPTGVSFSDHGDGTASFDGAPSGGAGAYPITISASNGIGLGASQSFTLNVDGTPELALTGVPANVTTDATSTSGATVTYTPPTAVDEETPPAVTCNHPSGWVFPIGVTTVTCSATDAGDGASSPATASFTVSVNDTDLAVTGVPANVTTDATSTSGATVTYTPPTAVDEETPPAVTCNHLSGSLFPIGVTTVTCSATDPGDGTASPATASFTVTVNDTDLALAGVPANITVNSTSTSGAPVTFIAPTAVDEETPPAVSCDHLSGSVFPIGQTTVHCAATGSDDGAASPATASFTVTVNDTDLSLRGVPAPITANATGPSGTTIAFAAPTAIDEETPPAVSCDHTSGSVFPIGVTIVHCSASDSADGLASPVTAAFTVTVKGALAQLNDLLTYVNSLLPTGLTAEVHRAITYYQGSDKRDTCTTLGTIVVTATAETGKHITWTAAHNVITAAKRIEAVIGCPPG